MLLLLLFFLFELGKYFFSGLRDSLMNVFADRRQGGLSGKSAKLQTKDTKVVQRFFDRIFCQARVGMRFKVCATSYPLRVSPRV